MQDQADQSPSPASEIRRLKDELERIKKVTEVQTRELRESEERFSLAMKGANDGLWDWDLETDQVYFSPRWKSMLGYQEDELPNERQTWERLVHPEDKKRVLASVNAYRMGEADSYQVEMRMQHKEGREVVVLSRGFLVKRESDGKPVRLVGTHVDITARKRAEEHIARHVEILEMIALGSPASEIYDAIALMYESRHPGMRCSLLELQDGRLMHGGAPSLPEAYCQAVHGLKNGPNVGSCGTSTYTGKRVLVADIASDPKWAQIKDAALPHGMRSCWSEPIRNSQGKVLGAFGMYYDVPGLPREEESADLTAGARLAGIVMERDQANSRIRELAYKDTLTGVSSRAHFQQHLQELITQSQRHGRQFSLLYVDLDDFKNVNDSLGHDVGDELLKEVARRLNQVARDSDFVARLGGDEFCILVEEVENHLVAAGVAQRCLDAVSRPVELQPQSLIPACSIGIAHYPEDAEGASSLMKAADIALYAAKGQGKNRFAFYKPELTRKAEHRFQVEQSLREAIESQQLSLVYQPQVDLNTGKIVGLEVLSRWTDRGLGKVEPAEFIPTAERMGMMQQHTEWVLETACQQLVKWKQAGVPDLSLAVNVSPRHFVDPGIVALVRRVLSDTGIEPDALELEVTESAFQNDLENLPVLNQLKDLGIQLAVDDFGTGYSSFASLKHLNVDCLKIDKYFIDELSTDEQSRVLVGSMIDMGRNLGHDIVAEGIESSEQADILRDLGCRRAQGYFMGRPVAAESLSDLLLRPTQH